MLNIINNLQPFFEDCYRRINVREYSRIMKISPPTASKILADFSKEGLLLTEKDRNYIFYYSNRDSKIFLDLSRIYWRVKLNSLITYFNKSLLNHTIILFGSLSKSEAKKDSDIDLCIIGEKKNIKLNDFERTLKRKIQLLFFDSIQDINNNELKNNIINGYVLSGGLRL